MEFVKIKGDIFAIDAIISVRKVRNAPTGIDNVERGWVVRVTPESMAFPPDPKHCTIWASEEEVQPVLEALERRMKPDETQSQANS